MPVILPNPSLKYVIVAELILVDDDTSPYKLLPFIRLYVVVVKVPSGFTLFIIYPFASKYFLVTLLLESVSVVRRSVLS